jgi:glycosyltransferase involved in cell wall biosynthesis
MSQPLVTVVIPTKDRPVPLARCLAALRAQDVDALEIVVVDDGSRDDRAVARVVAASPGARLLRVRGRGPAAARNLGAEVASAPVVCFTDDDCAPVPSWVRSLLDALDAGARVAAGPTCNADPRARCAVAAQTITNHLVDRSRSGEPGAETVGFVPTCNLAVSIGTARSHPFDEDFPLAAGEDREWCARLADSGIAIRWVPDARVMHHQNLPWKSFWRQQVRYGHGARRHHSARPRGERYQSAGFYGALVRRGFDEGLRVGVLVLVAQVAIAAGLVADKVGIGTRS